MIHDHGSHQLLKVRIQVKLSITDWPSADPTSWQTRRGGSSSAGRCSGPASGCSPASQAFWNRQIVKDRWVQFTVTETKILSNIGFISDTHLGSAVLAGCVISDTWSLILFSKTQYPQFQPQAPQSDPIPSFLEHLQGSYVVSNLLPESLQSTRWPPQAELISQCVSWYTSGRTHSETEERIWVNPCTSCGTKSRNKKGCCVHHKNSSHVELPLLLKPYISLLFHCILLQNRH